MPVVVDAWRVLLLHVAPTGELHSLADEALAASQVKKSVFVWECHLRQAAISLNPTQDATAITIEETQSREH